MEITVIDLNATYIHNKKEVKPTGRIATKERTPRLRRGGTTPEPTVDTLHEMIPSEMSIEEAKSFTIWVEEHELFKVQRG